MDLLSTIRTRKTARTYGDRPVPAEVIAYLLQLAGFAPSACNKQGWKCLLVESKADLEWLYNSGGSSVLHTAQQALVVCYQKETDNNEWNDNIQSAAAFIAYFQLAAHEIGIGSCWICHLPPKRDISAYFKIPTTFVPVAVVSFGYYKDGVAAVEKSIQPSGRILARSRWDFTEEESRVCHGRGFKFRKAMRELYYRLPRRHWLRGLAGKYEKKFDSD